MLSANYVASFVRHGAGRALFVGLYRIGRNQPVSHSDYWQVPAYAKLREFGMTGALTESRPTVLWFDLAITSFHSEWKGKLIIRWPPPELSWWRRAHKNELKVDAILEESALVPTKPLVWEEVALSWHGLSVLPARWKAALSEWRGVYFIFDSSDGKSYVGSAYGDTNLLGRWLNYAASGHGGNRLLRYRDPRNFQFSILQRVSPDLSAEDVIRIEVAWKERLHTRAPFGLNQN